jgi:virC1 protein
MTKFVLFNSIKGGVGKSTLAAQTAVFLADFGRVAVMDCDPQQNLNRWLMRRNEAGGKFLKKNFPPLPADLDFSSKNLNQFDFVVIDSAGVDSKTGRKALLNADYLISPLKPS